MVDKKHLAVKSFRLNSGWRSRGYLPHFDAPKLTQFVTFRLFDSLPLEVMETLAIEKGVTVLKERQLEILADRGYGSCMLADPRVGKRVQECLLFPHGKSYTLHAWVIMPNHIHLLVTLLEGERLETVIQRIKSASAHFANQILDRNGKFWAKEYFDRYIRDSRHFAQAVNYIAQNPVKAGLSRTAETWRLSSSYLHK